MKGCKDCPAYAKCTATYRGSACAALRGTYGIESDPEIITNADRIRAMSNEELAQFIFEIYEQPLKDGYLQWIQQPVKETE